MLQHASEYNSATNSEENPVVPSELPKNSSRSSNQRLVLYPVATQQTSSSMLAVEKFETAMNEHDENMKKQVGDSRYARRLFSSFSSLRLTFCLLSGSSLSSSRNSRSFQIESEALFCNPLNKQVHIFNNVLCFLVCNSQVNFNRILRSRSRWRKIQMSTWEYWCWR